LNALSRLGFSAPTHIQAECLPAAIRDRRDIIGAAQTGSGKTLAFGLPILNYLYEEKMRNPDFNPNGLKALIMVPTRELCMQVCKHVDPIARRVGVRVVPIVGGISHQKQERLLTKHPPAIIAATPGRLWELIREGHAHVNDMSSLKFLVLDEADRMVQQGHYQELTSIFNLVSNQAMKRRVEGKRDALQTFVFSATLTLPSEMKKRLKRGGGGAGGGATLEALMDAVPFASSKPKVVDISTSRKIAEKVTESYISCPEKERDAYLYCILAAHPGRTLVFVNAISAVRRIAAVFKILGLPVTSLHAGMQQRARLKALDKFTRNEDSILIATDVAARGLDIKDVACVIHYQIPASVDTYVHRSGRTARAEEDGISIAFVTPKEQGRFQALLHSIGSREEGLPEFPIDLSLMGECRKRVHLACQYDSLTRIDSKVKAEKSWKKLNAEQLGIVLSDDSDEELEGRKFSVKRKGAKEYTKTNKEEQFKRANSIKAELDMLLSEPLQPKFSRKFFTGGAASGVAVSQKLSTEPDTKSMVQEARKMAAETKNAQNRQTKIKKKKSFAKPRSRQEALALAVKNHLSKKAKKKNKLVVANPFGRNKGSTALEAMKKSM